MFFGQWTTTTHGNTGKYGFTHNFGTCPTMRSGFSICPCHCADLFRRCVSAARYPVVGATVAIAAEPGYDKRVVVAEMVMTLDRSCLLTV